MSEGRDQASSIFPEGEDPPRPAPAPTVQERLAVLARDMRDGGQSGTSAVLDADTEATLTLHYIGPQLRRAQPALMFAHEGKVACSRCGEVPGVTYEDCLMGKEVPGGGLEAHVFEPAHACEPKALLDWLDADWSRLEDVRGYLKNDGPIGATVADAVRALRGMP